MAAFLLASFNTYQTGDPHKRHTHTHIQGCPLTLLTRFDPISDPRLPHLRALGAQDPLPRPPEPQLVLGKVEVRVVARERTEAKHALSAAPLKPREKGKKKTIQTTN